MGFLGTIVGYIYRKRKIFIETYRILGTIIVSDANNPGSLYMCYNDGRVKTSEFSSFNSVILDKVNLYKYEGQVYISTTITSAQVPMAPHAHRGTAPAPRPPVAVEGKK